VGGLSLGQFNISVPFSLTFSFVPFLIPVLILPVPFLLKLVASTNPYLLNMPPKLLTDVVIAISIFK